jgi:hypothetical protein
MSAARICAEIGSTAFSKRAVEIDHAEHAERESEAA